MCPLVQSNTIQCNNLQCVCCCNRLYHLVKCCVYAIPPVYAHQMDQIIEIILWFSHSFWHVQWTWIFLQQSGYQRLRPLCKPVSSCLLAVTAKQFKQTLNSSRFSRCEALSEGGGFNVQWGRKEDKQQAKPPSSTKCHFFHEHQSFKTSSSTHLFLHPSMTAAVLCFCTHAHTVIIVEVLGQWVELYQNHL